MQNTKRVIVWTVVLILALIILMAMQFTGEVQWNEAIAYIVILLAFGSIYELWQWLKNHNKVYRFAFGIGLMGLLLIGWVNGAVGIIGSEDNSANLLYGAVFIVGLTGSIISRFKSHGMALVLFTMALVQFLVPVVALIISPEVSWGNAGVLGVFFINSIFAVLFVGSGLLFHRAGKFKNQ